MPGPSQKPVGPLLSGYHVYTVAKSFTVWQGSIAPWFEQADGGQQIQLDAALVPGAPKPKLNVKWLVDNGYLKRT
ncbi:TNT domain-containing protein [Streptomyces sp. URMC 124]|uniref:TNT domain-containing protein n=1 Tax=Streptomyces sp. URMC 124 TaxID=3423405 RepID=UPI003F1A57C2